MFFILIEGGAGESNDDDDDAEVHDVSAIAPGIAVGELDHRREHALVGVSGDDFASAIVLASDGERDQDRKPDGHQGIEVGDVLPGAHAEGRSPGLRGDHEEGHHPDCTDGRPHEIALQAFERCFAPCQQGSDCGENQEQQGDRDRDTVIKRRAHGDFVPLRQFGNLWEPRAPEHGEAEQHKQKIVE